MSLHKSLHSEANFQSVGVQSHVLEQLANGVCPSSISCVTSWHRAHSSSQQSKLAFRVTNVTTFLHVEQGRSSPILFADQTVIQG